MTSTYSVVDSLAAADRLAVYPSSQGDWRVATLTTLLAYLSSAFTSLTASSYVKVTPCLVAALPAAATAGAGARAFVTDANSTTFNATVTGGSTNKVPVFSDGTNWRIG